MALAILVFAIHPGDSEAQYTPIPDYVGISAGREFRGDINNHLSGVTPIAPRIVGLPLAQFPPERDGQLYWCNDCEPVSPCSAGGSGALAFGQDGQWICSAGASGLPAGASTGNLLLQSGTGVAWGNLSGDVSNSTSSPGLISVNTVLGGKSPLYSGELGAKLTVTTGGIAVRSTSSEVSGNVTSQAVNAPSGLADNDVEVACFNWEGGATPVSSIVQPSGWTAIGTPQTGGGSNTATTQCSYHAITNAAEEPASYTWSWTTAAYLVGGIVDFTGVNTTTPVDVSSGGTAVGGNGDSATVASMALANQNDLVVAIAGQFAGTDTITPGVPGATMQISLLSNGTTVYTYVAPISGAVPSYAVTFTDSSARASSVSQVALISAETASNAPLINATTVAPNGLVASGTFPYSTATNPLTGYSHDGYYNVVAYGADPTGAIDSTAGIQAAVTAACAASGLGGAKPTVFFPVATYKIWKGPVVDNCGSGISFVGARGATLNGQFIGGKLLAPLLLFYPSTMLSEFGAITTSPLVGATGNSFLFPWPNSNRAIYWNLNDVMTGLPSAQPNPLNGLAAFDVEFFFSPSFARSNDQTYDFWASSGCDICEPGGNPGTGGDAGAGFLEISGTSGSNSIGGELKIGGTVYTFNGTANVAVNTTHFAELSYDGGNIRLILDGKLIADTAATGTITQRVDETEILGGHNVNGWPDDGATAEQYAGSIFSFQISKAARNTCGGSTTLGATCYTTPTTALSGDANSLLLINGDGYNATYGTMGVDYAGGSYRLTSAKLIPRMGANITQGATPIVRDLALTNAASGLMVIAEPQWKAQDLTITNMSDAGMLAYSNAYSGETQNISMNGAGVVGVENDLLSSEVNYNLQITGSEYASTNPEKIDKLIWTPSAAGLAGVVWHMQTSAMTGLCIDCLMDVEAGGAAVPFKIVGVGGSTVQIVGGNMQTATGSNVEGMDIYGSPAITVVGGAWSGGTSTPEVLKFESGSSGARVVWDNPVINSVPWTRALSIPLSNAPSQVAAITGAGVINPCSGTVALTSGTPSTATVTNACVTSHCQCSDQTSASAIQCTPTPGASLAITGPNSVTDTIAWSCQ